MKKTITAVREKFVADFITPVTAYLLSGKGEYSFLLESAEKGRAGRFSFIGFYPRRVYILFAGGVKVMERGEEGELSEKKIIKTDDPLTLLQKVQDSYRLKDNGDLPPFCGGLVGYAGYELIRSFENISFKKRDKDRFPPGVFMFIDEIISFDHLYNTAEIIKITEKGKEKEAFKRIKVIKKIIKKPLKIEELKFCKEKEPPYISDFSKEEFENGVKNIKRDIVKGEIIQAVLSRQLEAPAPEKIFNCYRALRAINPSPYMFYLKLKDIILCGSSPEVMVKTSGKKALLRPIAGTRPRSACFSREKELRKELLKDPKEIAEHIMLVDLGRNDLSRVCARGSVKVKKLMAVEKYSHVMHMVTDIRGDLKRGVGNTEVFKACFPAGTVSGAPKIRAMEIIDREEKSSRGPYAGAVGYFSFTGDMDTCIAIRTMVIKDKKVFIRAGAGIVADSCPQKEFSETMNKSGALLQALHMAEGK